MLTRRQIAPDDFGVYEDDQLIGRIRLARDRAPPIWLWTITVTIPGPPFGSATTIDKAKWQFKRAWTTFKQQHGAERLAAAYAEMQTVNEAVATTWSNRTGSPTAKEKQAVLDQTAKQLADLKISEEERREIVRPYVQMIGFDFYMIYVRTFDRYLNWKSDELLRRYNAGNSPESKKALEDWELAHSGPQVRDLAGLG